MIGDPRRRTSADLFAAARRHDSPERPVELAAAIALENFRGRFNRLFDVAPNGLYCPVPPRGE